MIVILPKHREVFNGTISQRISSKLNDGITHICLKDFDYLLRIDCDEVLPLNLLEENLKLNVDICGASGHQQLIKISVFLKIMNGKFDKDCDDSYISLKFMKEGYTYHEPIIKVVNIRKSGTNHKLEYYVNKGILKYRLGVNPFFIIQEDIINIWNIIIILSYFWAILIKVKRYDIANFTSSLQNYRLKKFLLKRMNHK